MVAGGFVTNVVWAAYGFSQKKIELIGPDLVAVTVGVTYLATVLALRIRSDCARTPSSISAKSRR